MKLQTSIKPRRDGTVKVTGQDRQTYVFVADESSGDLSCDVTDTATVASLLAGGEFWPANQEDHDAALALTVAGDDEDDEPADGDDLVDDVGDINALPLEANTPPVVRRKPGPKPKAK